jgi:hypothetical protein
VSLLNLDYIRNVIHRDAPWASSHASDRREYLGGGLLYYTLAYMTRARLCVCLGSGGGFVPRLMRQAQRDLGLHDARTVLVDANIGHTASGVETVRRHGQTGRLKWGYPQWVAPDSFFRTAFPDIEIIMRLTADVAAEEAANWQIDYLHIDADYSHEGRLADLAAFRPRMAPNGLITMHDTDGTLPCSRAVVDLRAAGHDVINLPELGCGLALVAFRSDAVGGIDRPAKVVDRFLSENHDAGAHVDGDERGRSASQADFGSRSPD